MTKRGLILVVVVALALGSLGILTASAATQTRQNEGQGWLGVAIEDTDDGVKVREVVPGSPAAEAGIIVGDVIVAVDGETISSADALVETIRGRNPGDEVTLTVRTLSEEHKVTVTLGERPAGLDEQPAPPFAGRPGFKGILNFLGVTLEVTDKGLLVQALEADSPLADLGFEEGDVITAINGTPISELRPRDLMRTLRAGETVTFTVLRDGEEVDIEVDIPDALTLPGGLVEPGQMMMSFLGVDLNWTSKGLVVEQISPDSPLADAGFEEGDIITEINGEPIVGGDPLRFLIEPGQRVTFTVLRDGEEVEIEVEWPDFGFGFEFGPGGPRFGIGAVGQPSQLGIRFQVVTEALAAEQNLTVQEGAWVEEVFEDTPASEAGLQEGDVITAVNGEPVDEEHTLVDRLYAYEEGDVVTLTVQRGEEQLELEVTLGPNPRDMMRGFGPGMWMPYGMMEPGQDMMPFGKGWMFFGPQQGGMPNYFFEVHPFKGREGGILEPAPATPPIQENNMAVETGPSA